jgi:two-component system sensor histidine kinase MtrB
VTELTLERVAVAHPRGKRSRLLGALAGTGLRFRITASFALGALVLAVTLSMLAYGLTRRSLVHSRQTSSVRQAVAAAGQLESEIRSANPDVNAAIRALVIPSGSDVVVLRQNKVFSNNFFVGTDSFPASLRAEVAAAGRPASMEFDRGSGTQFVVGIPLPAVRAEFYQLFDLSDLSRSLDALAISLAAASLATAVAGVAAGRWASRRVLSPLTQTARAAAAIAAGSLDTRLEAGEDSDLADLVSSFNSMVSALQRRIESDARFASDVSHELRSPLTTLSTAVEVLQRRRTEMPERSVRALDLLTSEVVRFERLVEDLLEVSRFDAGAADLALEPVDPSELVRQAVSHLGYWSVPVVVAPSAERLTISADKRRVERMLANLLANAAAHAGGAIRVTVEGRPRGVRVGVDDAGSGVPVAQREAIFERFARGIAAGNRSRSGGDGVGLGLSLVREHARLHDGTVWVEDSPEGGARFVFELPFNPKPSVPSRPRAHRRTGLRVRRA